MAPSGGPLKRVVCRGKAEGFEGPCPLGAAKDSSAFFSAYSSKYCHNGGMALRTGFSPERDHRTPPSHPVARKNRVDKRNLGGRVRLHTSFGAEMDSSASVALSP
jgi:hypothetical protein